MSDVILADWQFDYIMRNAKPDYVRRLLVALWNERLRNAPRTKRKRRRGPRALALFARGVEKSVVEQAIRTRMVPCPISPLTRQGAHSLATARRWNREGVRGPKRSTWTKEVGACPM